MCLTLMSEFVYFVGSRVCKSYTENKLFVRHMMELYILIKEIENNCDCTSRMLLFFKNKCEQNYTAMSITTNKS